MLILFYWVREYPVTALADVAGLDPKTAVDAYQWLREVCSTALLQTQTVLGGPNVVVQIDESLFRRKPKVK